MCQLKFGSTFVLSVLLGTSAVRAETLPSSVARLASIAQVPPQPERPNAGPNTQPSPAQPPSTPPQTPAPTTGEEPPADVPESDSSTDSGAEVKPAEPVSGDPQPVPRIEAEDSYETAPPATAPQPPPTKNTAPTADVPVSEAKAAKEQDEPEKPKFNTLILAEAVGRYGSVGDSLDREGLDRESYRAGYVGGQATLGLMPGGKYFTMAARLGGGTFLGGREPLGAIGAAMLFGANFMRNETGDTYSYALGGAGVFFVPGINQDMLALHVTGGTVIKSISFSAGIDLGGNEEFGFAVFGMQVGWGHLY